MHGLRFRAAALAAMVVAAVALPGRGETELKTVAVEGRGETREAAMIDGFAEALRQVNGVKLDFTRELSGVFSETASGGSGGTSRETSYSSSQSEKVRTATKGAIRSYSVDSAGRDPDGTWTVNLRVNVASYVAPGLGADSRRKIVVWPFGA
ncbi:MAG: hypothetical protein IJS46_06065, partial [Kiritimatiellae bacterium]|nr:hypothetical protein [Kiritimatiellia bacterium]